VKGVIVRRIILACLLLATITTDAQSPRLLILNKEEGTLHIVDPASGKLLGKSTTGAGPHEVVVSADGRLAFTSNYGTGQAPGRTLSVIDLKTQKELQRVDLSPLARPHGLWWANDRVYFTAEANRRIARYDPAANKVDWEFETGQEATHMVLLTRNGRTIATTNIASDTVSIIEQDAGGNWAQTVVPVGRGPEGMDLSPDDRQLWVAHSRDGGVSVIDIATQKVLHTIPVGTKRSNRLKITPDGRLALISDLDAGELVVLDTAARNVVKRLPIGKMLEGILIPNNEHAFVAVTGENYVAVVDLKSLEVTRKIPAGAGPDGMAWLP
jgi:YVTN family beta-propeller protein